MGRFDYANARDTLLFEDLLAQGLHPDPVHLRTEMMLGVVTVKKPDPIVKLAIATYAPGERFVRIAAVVPVIAVEVGKAVAKVIKGKKETDVVPVENSKTRKSTDKKR